MEVGDKVKVIARKWGHNFKIGEIVTLCTLETESGHRFKGDTGMRLWMTEEEYEVMQPIGTLAEIGAQVGDVVEWLEDDGSEGEHHTVTGGPDHYGDTWPSHMQLDGDYAVDIRDSHCQFRMIRRASDYKPGSTEPPSPVRLVPQIVPGVYGRISIHKNTENDGKVLIRLADGAGEVNLNNCGHYMSRAELIAARDVFNQIIDAMEEE